MDDSDGVLSLVAFFVLCYGPFQLQVFVCVLHKQDKLKRQRCATGHVFHEGKPRQRVEATRASTNTSICMENNAMNVQKCHVSSCCDILEFRGVIVLGVFVLHLLSP
jgi:hypothetical protein